MPRGPRIDTPGLLHHVIVRGIERSKIFKTKGDYQDFLGRLDKVLAGTDVRVLAWALMPNHVHLLIKTGNKRLSSIMRRVLTGYALSFNRRHKRVGYLYQGRYKSIVCQEEPYLLELVRYIHLNPLRVKLVRTIEELEQYLWTGHLVLMGRKSYRWQDTVEILQRFGQNKYQYREYIKEGISQGQRPDLNGGGLIRSLGGVGRAVIANKSKEKQMYDQRILGDGEFVAAILKQTADKGRSLPRISLSELIARVGRYYQLKTGSLLMRKKQKGLGKIKAVVVNVGIDHLGIPGRTLAEKLGLSKSAISKLNRWGEIIVANDQQFLAEIFK